MIDFARYFLAWMCIGGIIANVVVKDYKVIDHNMSSVGKSLFVIIVMFATPFVVIYAFASLLFRKS